MKLEFLSDGSPDCPLIRLYAFTSAEARELHDIVLELATGGAAAEVHRLPFVEPIDNCRLTLQVTPWDQGLVRRTESSEFTCGLTTDTWDNVASLVEPFVEGSRGFQWLAGGEAALLLSSSGRW